MSELPSSLPSSGENQPFTVPPNWRYEDAVRRVEAMIDRIESGELELAEVFSQFAEAVESLRQCEEFLTHQRQQVDLLIETLLDDPSNF